VIPPIPGEYHKKKKKTKCPPEQVFRFSKHPSLCEGKVIFTQ
jgi:hypothetical protein